MPDKHGEPTRKELCDTAKRLLDHEVKHGIFSPTGRAAADEFFAHKKKHPEPVAQDKLTPLQKRMGSGSA